MSLLLQLSAAAWAIVLPGWLLSLQLEDDPGPIVRGAIGVTLGLLLVPMLSFCAAWLFGTNIRPPLVVAVGTVANAALFGAWWFRRKRERA